MKNYEELVPILVKKVMDELLHTELFKYVVPIGISNRHVHLKREDVEILFGPGYELTKLKELKQTGEFACVETVTLMTTIQGKERMLENVRILGPIRPKSQVEISKTEARFLKVSPPVRNSGDLKGSEKITLLGPKGRVDLQEGLILATRHIHLSEEDAKRLQLQNGDRVSVEIQGEKPGRLDEVHCKVHKNYVLEMHLDTDDGNAFLLETGAKARILPPNK